MVISKQAWIAMHFNPNAACQAFVSVFTSAKEIPLPPAREVDAVIITLSTVPSPPPPILPPVVHGTFHILPSFQPFLQSLQGQTSKQPQLQRIFLYHRCSKASNNSISI
ncbi:unnamed protein product [Vicia faba]|uniref:Uncharacterized protein n=1 Tax=Vicia faba TaxID=3906 RepID=A0AAV1BCV4_VICFA|nr:unnamed protein product [Vicia faba]